MLEGKKEHPMFRGSRLRRTHSLRQMFSETRLHPDSLVSPLFIIEGKRRVEEIRSMPGVMRYTVDEAAKYVAQLQEAGVRGVLVFGIPKAKDPLGTEAYSKTGVVPRAVSLLKKAFPDLVVMADVCLCEYTDHGHCGVVAGGRVDNDGTLPLLARAAVEYARAGADMVAPSAMMDGQVGAIRRALDGAGFAGTSVMGYSAKYASSFYGPFREAAGSSPAFGDRRSYQMNPANAREAMKEIEDDIDEGADVVMVKPALAYLDVIAKARSRFDSPLAAYNVSGEYAMVKAAAKAGWIDERAAVLEMLTSIRRAGADVIVTYFALQAARWLREEG